MNTNTQKSSVAHREENQLLRGIERGWWAREWAGKVSWSWGQAAAGLCCTAESALGGEGRQGGCRRSGMSGHCWRFCSRFQTDGWRHGQGPGGTWLRSVGQAAATAASWSGKCESLHFRQCSLARGEAGFEGEQNSPGDGERGGSQDVVSWVVRRVPSITPWSKNPFLHYHLSSEEECSLTQPNPDHPILMGFSRSPPSCTLVSTYAHPQSWAALHGICTIGKALRLLAYKMLKKKIQKWLSKCWEPAIT